MGAHEAKEKRDGEKRVFKKGVLSACRSVREEINKELSGREFSSPDSVDEAVIKLDGTKDKSRLGSNAVLAVSIAQRRAFAGEEGLPLYLSFGEKPILPCPMMNILNGGVHADNSLDIQEFMIMPAGALTFRECMDMGMETYFYLKSLLKQKGFSTAVGDEGGFAPDLKGDEHALEIMSEAVIKAGLTPGRDIYFALDAASSEWFDGKKYVMKKSGRHFSKDELIDYYKKLTDAFCIVSLEDGLNEDDFAGFSELTKKTGVQTVGDDLFVTDTERIKKGIENSSARAVLIKPNQIGSVMEACAAVRLAKEAGLGAIISHRSGDTEDSFIADMCVGLGAGQIKTGAPARAERTAKYSRLLFIEHELGKNAVFAGKKAINSVKWLDTEHAKL